MGIKQAIQSPDMDLLAWLEQAARTTRNGITITDLYGKIVYTNPAEANMHGYEVDELLGADAWIMAPSHSAQPMPVGEMKQVRNWRRESINKKKDGSLFPVFLISDAVLGADGEPVGMLTISEDLSEQKKAEHALGELDHRYSQLAANLPGIIFQFHMDEAGKITFPLVSDGVRELAGIDPEEIVANPQKAFELVVPEDLNPLLDSIRTAAENVSDWDHEVRMRPVGSDETRWLRGLARPRKTEDGEIEADGILLDVTEKKLALAELERIRGELEIRVAERTEQLSQTNQSLLDQVDEQHRVELELKHSNAILTAQQNAIDSGILVVDSNGAITTFNQRLLDIWELDEDFLRNATVRDVIDAVRPKIEQPTGFESVIDEARKDPGITRSGMLLRLKSGTYLMASVAPVKLIDGHIAGRAWSFTDITPQQEAERALERRVRFVRFVTDLSTRFIGLRPEDFDSAIDSALLELGEFAGVDRSYVFIFSEDGSRMTNTHEWCAEGVKRFMEGLQDIPGESFAYFWQFISRGEIFRVPRVEDLPPEAEVERAEFLSEAIKSILCVPMVSRGKSVGFVGFDAVNQEDPWDEDTVALLRLVGEVFSNSLERNRNLAALHESENKFRLLFEASSEAVMIYGSAGFVDANPATIHLFGAESLEQLREKHPGRDLSPPTQPDGRNSEASANEAMARALQEGFHRFEWVHRTLQGRDFPAEVTLNALEIANRQMIQAIVRDLTDQKRSENLLRGVAHATDLLLTHPDYESVFDSVLGILGRATEVDRVYIFERHPHPDTGKLSVSCRFEWCSEGTEPQIDNPMLQNLSVDFVQLPEWEQEMLSGHPVAALTRELPPGMKALQEMQNVKSILLVPIPVSGDYWGFIGFDACREERTWADGEQSGLVAMAASIGSAMERRKKDEAIERSESRWRSLVENAPDIIMNVDREGSITFINKVVEGYRMEDVLGTSMFDFTDESSHHILREALDHVFETGTPTSYEVGAPGANHQPATWSAHMGPIISDGKVVGANIISRDITDRLQEEEARLALERKLLEAQKLESLGVLAGGIAHDFNNLLMSVLGNAALALMDIPPESPIRETVERIELAAKRAGELTQQLLAYSGKGRFVVGPISLNRVIEEMTHLLRVSISKNVTIRYHLSEGLPPIEGDATQLRQVAMNLITNGSDAIGNSDGVVTVSTGERAYSAEDLSKFLMQEPLDPGNYVFLEISDTGTGMDEETLGKIFDPFFTTKFTGRGLGLAAVLGIVRGHGGALHVKSTPEEGTTFHILFPRCREGTDVSNEETRSREQWHGTGVVLVVDDEETIRTVTSNLLKKVGYEVLTAEDGPAAIELFRKHADEVAYVLLDMTMPNLSGPETLEKIREIRSDARVILMSGYSEVEALSHFGEGAPAGFLQKPFGPDEIQAVFKKLSD